MKRREFSIFITFSDTYTGVHLSGGGGALAPLEHTGFTPVSNSCYKKPHLFIVCPPSMNFCMQPCTCTLWFILVMHDAYMYLYIPYLIGWVCLKVKIYALERLIQQGSQTMNNFSIIIILKKYFMHLIQVKVFIEIIISN